MAVLLQLLEQVAESAADHAAGGAPGEQAAEAAFQNIADSAARHSGIDGARRGRGSRRCTGLTAAEMFHRLPGEQTEDRHGHRRHAAAGLRAWGAGTARAVLHAVEYVE